MPIRCACGFFRVRAGFGNAILLFALILAMTLLPFPLFFGPSLIESVLSLLVVPVFEIHR
jgi:hypothetical protein